jgi:branched-chain amino acid transport system permease protein
MVQSLVNGLVLGSLFAVLAIGLTLVYGVMEVPNFAHAGVLTVGAYTMYALDAPAGLPFWAAVVGGILVAGVVSLLTDTLAYRFVRDRPLAAPAVALGLLLILDNSMLRVFGGEGKALSPPYASRTVHLGHLATLSAVNLAVVLVSLTSILLLGLVLTRTSIGRTVRAVSQDREAAAILGIPIQRQYGVAFFVSGLLAGIAALAFAPTTAVTPYMADQIILSAFVVVVLGGLGSVRGAIVGGIVLGVIESFAATYVSATYQTAFGFAVLLVILVVRPAGLFTTSAGRTA